ncbi:MAG: branched-chain amino acid transport system substrate-binding protein [Methylobacteriaceae bacterium]|jgi:branched-chain amino acid transport system substrate-binding protein|nr:branched-chain amino acid transport system substrate-binding protein [Methylobacteriaceae bacterium]
MRTKPDSIRRRHVLLGATAALTLGLTPAFAAEPIKIGFAMSLSGPNAGAGKMFLVGREVWKDEINAKGGLLGRPVQFVYYDDQSNPSLVPGIYSKLLDVDKVDLVVSPFATNQIAPAMPVIMQKKMTFMALFGTGVNDEFKYDRYFQILPNGPEGNRSFSLGFFETAMTMEPKPHTVAITGEDTEFGHNILAGARANIERLGLKIVYDRTFPASTVDHTPILRAIKAAEPDIVFVASYATGSVGMVRVLNEVGYKPRMFGGAMIGLQFTPVKAQLGPLLNGVVINENYVPEKTMNFPGVEDVLKRYQQRAAGAGTDPLGFWSPFAYAELQILGQAVEAAGGTDQGKLADYLHKTPFRTVIGDVKFGPIGEWEKSRILYIQYQNIRGNDLNQFREPGKAVILYPPELKSGELIYPLAKARGE